MPERIVLSWSGGKDCSYALYELAQNPDYKVEKLLTTMNRESNTISMHQTHKTLLDAQIASLNYPADVILMPPMPSNDTYNRLFREQMHRYKSEGITAIAFADLFLQDIKEYRQQLLKGTGLEAIFPLWQRNTKRFANEFIRAGFKAIVTCVDTKQNYKHFAGQQFDHIFLKSLPSGVDLCGENGEFHTFVYNGPVFKQEIQIQTGGFRSIEGRFYCCDLYLKESDDPYR